jgi:hypothetical protein
MSIKTLGATVYDLRDPAQYECALALTPEYYVPLKKKDIQKAKELGIKPISFESVEFTISHMDMVSKAGNKYIRTTWANSNVRITCGFKSDDTTWPNKQLLISDLDNRKLWDSSKVVKDDDFATD